MANPFKRGNTWTIYYYVQDDYGKRKQIWKGGYQTKQEAESDLKKFKAQVELGLLTYNSHNSIRLSQYLIDWLEMRTPALQPHTIDNYSLVINRHINPLIGDTKLQDLTPRAIQRFYSTLSTESQLSAKMIQFIHSVFKAALKGAIEEGLVKHNVFSWIKLPRPKKFKPQLLSLEQIQLLFRIIEGNKYETEIKLALLLGLRRGEVLGIMEEDIDFERHTLSIQRQVSVINDRTYNKNKQFIGLKCLKSESSNRTLYLSEEIEQLLRDRISFNNQQARQFGASYNHTGLVCCKKNGDIVNPQSLSNAFQKLLIRNGLPKIRFHDLRHSYATLCIDMKIPIKVISQALGHSSTAVTDLIYADSIKANRELSNIISSAIITDDLK